MNNFVRNIHIFSWYMCREIYTYRRYVKDLIINHVLLFPIIYSIALAYIQIRSYFGAQATDMSTTVFAGNIIIPIMVTAFSITFKLFDDLRKNKYITYQTMILHPRLVILQRLLFAWLLTFIVSVPFFPVSKLILGTILNTDNTQWHGVIGIIFIGSLVCACHFLLAAIVLKRPEQISSFWGRINSPLFILGGIFIPRHIIEQFSPILGLALYLNPMMYITEGLRQAMVGGPQFLSLFTCTTALIGISTLYIIACWYMFRRRIDHI